MRLVGSLVAVAVFATAAHTAHAQPAFTAPVEPAPPRKSKDPSTATNLSLIVPLVTMSAGMALMANDNSDVAVGGAVLFVGGGIVGPAAGHWYGGNIGGVGMLTRSVAAGTAFLSGVYLISSDHDGCWDAPDCTDFERRQQRNQDLAGGLLVGSILTYFVSALYDMTQADDVADSWNQKHGFTLAPLALPASGGTAAGAALSLRF